MLKGLLILSTLFSSINNNYIDVKSIECSSNINNNIEFVFYFDSDYVSYHEISVEFNLFRDNKNVANYNNSLTVIGKKRSVATMDYLYKENMYVLLTVYYENNKLVDHLRFDLKGNNSCSLDRNLKECNEFYKTVYDGKIIDRYSNIRILYFPFDSFLSMNYLDLSNLIIYSDYDFSDDFIYLDITRITGEYELINEDNYKLLLETNNTNNQYSFSLLETYYVNFEEFIYTDVYSSDYISTKRVYFPFADEYREYLCSLIIDGTIDIKIEFIVSTSDKLFGECADSKFCIDRSNYD